MVYYYLRAVAFCAALALLGTVSSQQNPSDVTFPLSTDDAFNYQYLVSLGQAPYHGADVNDILGAANKIRDGDFGSFNSTFYELAKRTHAAADEAANHSGLNAQDTYFAAANYWRSADFYSHGNWSDPHIYSYWEQQTTAFDRTIATLPTPGKRMTLSAHGFEVYAIWYGHGDRNRRPTIILGNREPDAERRRFHKSAASFSDTSSRRFERVRPSLPALV